MRARTRFRVPRLRNAGAATIVAALAVAGTGAAVSSAQASTGGKTVTVGFDMTLSGSYAVYSESEYGAEAYLKSVNSHGGINGYKFAFAQQDNGYSAATAAADARTLAQKASIILTAGTTPAQGIFAIAPSLQTPILAAANGAMFVPGKPYVYGVVPSYTQLPLADARFVVKRLGIKKIAFAYEDDDVGDAASKVISTYVKSIGGKVLVSVPVPATATDFSSFAAKLKASGAKAVVTIVGAPIVQGLQLAAVALGYSPKWTGIFGIQTSSYVSAVPSSVLKNTYSDAFESPISGKSAAVRAYEGAMKKYFPKYESSSLAAEGYGMGAIVASAVKSATVGKKALTKSTLNQAMSKAFHGQAEGLIRSVTYNSSEHFGSDATALYSLSKRGVVAKQVMPFMPMPAVPKS